MFEKVPDSIEEAINDDLFWLYLGRDPNDLKEFELYDSNRNPTPELKREIDFWVNAIKEGKYEKFKEILSGRRKSLEDKIRTELNIFEFVNRKKFESFIKKLREKYSIDVSKFKEMREEWLKKYGERIINKVDHLLRLGKVPFPLNNRCSIEIINKRSIFDFKNLEISNYFSEKV